MDDQTDLTRAGDEAAVVVRSEVAEHPYEQTLRTRRLHMRIVRSAFAVLFAVITGLSLFGGRFAGDDAAEFWPITLTMAIVVAGAVILVDWLTPEKKLSTIMSVMIGLLAAMLATAAIGFIIDLLAETYGRGASDTPVITIMKVLIGMGLAYLAISTIVQTQDDFRLMIPYVEFAKQIRGPRPLLLDSSALIDARIVALYETGMIQAPLIVPRFVIDELHALADSGDKMKRAKGRRAMDLIGRMQRSPNIDISIDETPIPGKGVDQKLVELARQMPGMIVTTDTGLARMAQIHETPVLNLNEVANALKPNVIPGEVVRVQLIKAGEQAEQGVGYLDDGTMVVAEDGAEHIGEEHDLFVTSSMQTSAGRLIFARVNPVDEKHGTGHEPVLESQRVQPPNRPSSRNPRR